MPQRVAPYIIAELGSNPALGKWGELGLFIISAKVCGADACKIQLFRASHFPEPEQVSKRAVEFPRERLSYFVEAVHSAGMEAGASVFDFDAIRQAENFDWLKLAGREQYNVALRLRAIKSGKKIYRSVADFNELSFWQNETPLGVVAEYPASMGKSLLRVVAWAGIMRSHGIERWGWSSHTKSALDCWAATKLGASVIEKHYALSRFDPEAVSYTHLTLPTNREV